MIGAGGTGAVPSGEEADTREERGMNSDNATPGVEDRDTEVPDECESETSSLALASAMGGLLSFYYSSYIACALALVLGLVALYHIGISRGIVRGRGFAVVGICLSSLGLAEMVVNALAER